MKNRIITGFAVAGSVLALLLLLPLPYVYGVIAVICSLGAYEWAKLSGLIKRPFKVCYALVQLLVILLAAQVVGLFATIKPEVFQDLLGVACLFWAIALLWVLSYPQSALIWSKRWLIGLMGFVVLVPAACALMYLVQQPSGRALVVCLIAFVALADTGAYFFGKQFGKKKLCPSVSPGKSWAGFLGGLLVVSIFSASLWPFFKPFGLSFLALWSVVIVTVLASVLGDLVESMVKRQAGIKDSGSLLPGHGGILDRIDSMTAAAPVFVLLTLLLAGA